MSPHAYPALYPIAASKDRWRNASFRRDPFQTYHGVRDIVRNYIKSPHKWDLEGNKSLDFLRQHLETEEAGKPWSRTVSSDGLLEDLPAEQPTLTDFAHTVMQRLDDEDAGWRRMAMHVLAAISADDPALVTHLKTILSTAETADTSILDAALNACGHCLRRSDEIEILFTYLDRTAFTWRSAEALARVAMFRDDALLTVDTPRVEAWVRKLHPLLSAPGPGSTTPLPAARASEALLYLLRRRRFDPGFAGPSSELRRETWDRLKEAKQKSLQAGTSPTASAIVVMDQALQLFAWAPLATQPPPRPAVSTAHRAPGLPAPVAARTTAAGRASANGGDRHPPTRTAPLGSATPATIGTHTHSPAIPHKEHAMPRTIAPDPEQRTVIETPAQDFVLVTAPPGAGKTAVACARVAWLTDKGVPAPRILMVSFTRTAVAEFQNRLEAMAKDATEVRGVTVTTLDAHAFRILRGLDEDSSKESLFGSYDANIDQILKRIHERHPGILEWIQSFQHILIDEAQDLVGARAALACEVLRMRAPGCGATVFADELQAIYGFANEDEDGNQVAETFFEALESRQLSPRQLQLTTIHRTSNPRLRGLFLDGRKPILDYVCEPRTAYDQTSEIVVERAGEDLGKFDSNLGLLRDSESLVLFRSRAQVMFASSLMKKDGIPHRIRMSGLPSIIEPWIGFLLGSITEPVLTDSQFRGLWQAATDHPCLKIRQRTVDTAWADLRKIAPGPRASLVDMRQLCARLAVSRPPLELTLPELGTRGPILGTIHASKGRESKDVLLLIRNSIHDKMTEAQILAEARVLYVGATRAIASLRTGESPACRASRVKSGRTWRLVNQRCQVEFGRDGDLEVGSPVSISRLADAETCVRSQQWLADHATSDFDLTTGVRDDSGYTYRLSVEDGLDVGALDQRVNADLFQVLRDSELRARALPRELKYLWSSGATTACLRADDSRRESLHEPYCRSGLFLAPVIRGLSMVYFMSPVAHGGNS